MPRLLEANKSLAILLLLNPLYAESYYRLLHKIPHGITGNVKEVGLSLHHCKAPSASLVPDHE